MPVIGYPIIPVGSEMPQPARGGRWYVTAAPTARVITPLELRRHCHLDSEQDPTNPNGDPQDDEMYVYIDAATEYVESTLSAALMPRTIAETFYDGQAIDLSVGPVISVASVIDRNSAALTSYNLAQIGYTTRIVPVTTAGTLHPVTVTYRAGYVLSDGTTPAIPRDIRLAVLQLAATYYANRESISEKSMIPIPHMVEAFFTRKSRTTGVG